METTQNEKHPKKLSSGIKLVGLTFLVFIVVLAISENNPVHDFVKSRLSGMKPFIDPRDGQMYPTVKIGDQIWMAKNLNYNSHRGSYCPNDDPETCTKYGRLYDWETAKEICPAGWHLPSGEEYANLIKVLGGDDQSTYFSLLEGGKSKFNLQLAGFFNAYQDDYLLYETQVIFWSSNENSNTSAYYFNIHPPTGQFIEGSDWKSFSILNKQSGLSVRYIKDK